MSREDSNNASEVLPLAEESLRISKHDVVSQRVRVRTVTDATEHLVRQELAGERLGVERVACDRLLAAGDPLPQIRVEGDVTILPVIEEVVIVEKRLRIREEIRITRHATAEIVETPVLLRKQRAEVERLNSEGEPIADNPEDHT